MPQSSFPHNTNIFTFEDVFPNALPSRRGLLEASGFLDIETTGLTAGESAIHQIAYLAPLTKEGKISAYEAAPFPLTFKRFPHSTGTTKVDTLRLNDESYLGIRTPTNWSEVFRNIDESFFHEAKQLIEPGGEMAKSRQYDFLGKKVLLERDTQLYPSEAIGNVFRIAKEENKKIMWIANAQFEAAHLGAHLDSRVINSFEYSIKQLEEEINDKRKQYKARQMSEAQIERKLASKINRIKKLDEMRHSVVMQRQFIYEQMNFTSPTGKGQINDFLYVNHPDILRARNLAFISNNWEPVLKAIEDLNVDELKGVTVLDAFDLIKGTTSRAANKLKEVGIDASPLGAVSRGIKLDFVSRAFYALEEKHFGMEDNVLTGRIVNDFLKIGQSLEEMDLKSVLLADGSIDFNSPNLKPEQKEALKKILKMAEIKKQTNKHYARLAVQRIIKDELETTTEKPFKHTVMGSYRTEWTEKEVKGDPNQLRPKRQMVPVVKNDYLIYRGPEEALAGVSKLPGNEEIPEAWWRQTYDEEQDFVKRMKEVADKEFEAKKATALLKKEIFDESPAAKEKFIRDKLQHHYGTRISEHSYEGKNLLDTPEAKAALDEANNLENLNKWNRSEIIKETDWTVSKAPSKEEKPRWKRDRPPSYDVKLPSNEELASIRASEYQEEIVNAASTLKARRESIGKFISEVPSTKVFKGAAAIIGASMIFKGISTIYDLATEKPLNLEYQYDTFGVREESVEANTDESEEMSPIEDGMDEKGIAKDSRRELTDFGSPYRGKEEGTEDLPSFQTIAKNFIINFERSRGETPVFFEGMKIDQRVIDFQMFLLNTPFKKQQIEAMMNRETEESLKSTYFLGSGEGLETERVTLENQPQYQAQGITFKRDMQRVVLSGRSKNQLEMEDADTILIHGGPGGQAASFRLSGIDAPEIGHEGEAIGSLRFKQNQPYGEEARERFEEIINNAKQVEILFDPKQETYGRSLGVVFADGVNVNTQLVKEGWVKALPFGKAEDELIDRKIVAAKENQAYAKGIGMWQSDFWRTEKQLSSAKYRMTNNMLTRLDKLASNNTLAAAETLMSHRENDTGTYNDAFQSAKRKLALLGSKRPPFRERNWRPNYYNNEYSIIPRAQSYPSFSYGNNNMLTLSMMKSSYLKTPSMIDSTTYSDSIYSYRKPTIMKKYMEKSIKPKTAVARKEFHKQGQIISMGAAQTQGANQMMSG